MKRKVDEARRQEAALKRQNESRATSSSDFHYAIQISVRLLRPIGAWPLAHHETSRLKIILYRAVTTITMFLMIFTIAPWIICIVKQRWSAYLIFRSMCPLLFTLMIFARYVLLICHQKRMRLCVDRMADDWRCHTTLTDDRVIMLEYARLGRMFGIVSVVFMFSCGILFYVMPLAISGPIGENNVTVRLHPTPCELLVLDSKVSPVYEIVYLLQVICGYVFYSTFSGICSLMAHFVMHVCGQCDLLTVIFEETIDGGEHNSGTIDTRIATAVNRHLRLLKLASDVSGLFTELCVVEFVNALCNICLIGYYIISDLNNNESYVQIFMYLFALVSVIFNIFVFCYIGDSLTERCQMLGSACYSVEWYRMPARKAIELMMPIMMSRYPVTLTAGKMVAMTLSTFSDILKTSMAYFNLLREFLSRDAVRM